VGIKTFFSHRKIGVYSERLMFRSLNNDNKNQETFFVDFGLVQHTHGGGLL